MRGRIGTSTQLVYIGPPSRKKPKIKAHESGVCDTCKRPYDVGTVIVENRHGKIVHANCPVRVKRY